VLLHLKRLSRSSIEYKAILRATFTICVLCTSLLSLSETVNHRLYLNAGIYTAVDTTTFPMASFNWATTFVAQNARITLQAGDSLSLTVVNNDTLKHGFLIKDQTSGEEIEPGDSINLSVFFSEADYATIYYDHLNNSSFRAGGLGGIIHVSSSPDKLFYWNIKDFQKSWAPQLVAGESVNWMNYYPDYFTINGRSNPLINLDSVARVNGSVGDKIQIVMANTGASVHSIHFHGYHAEIMYSSVNETHTGRLKDTFPIKSMETIILEIIPDKPGEYPVHDHNLSAVSAGGIYPNGMFLTMLIE
jgi:hypothetical protein